MKKFDIQHDTSGCRLLIWPAGTLARRAKGYVDAPYIEVHNSGSGYDNIELVRAGFVRKRESIRTLNDPIGNGPRCHNLQKLINLMKEL